MRRGVKRRILAAWAVGWVVYMMAMTAWSYDGLMSLVFQPFLGAAISLIFVAAASVVGLALLLPPLGRLWCSTWIGAATLAGASVLVMLLGSSCGLTQTYQNPDTGQQFQALSFTATLVSYVGLIFAILYWPDRRRRPVEIEIHA